jgi:hypothetical protein
VTGSVCFERTCLSYEEGATGRGCLSPTRSFGTLPYACFNGRLVTVSHGDNCYCDAASETASASP